MELKAEARLLRIFLGESDHLHHAALHECLLTLEAVRVLRYGPRSSREPAKRSPT